MKVYEILLTIIYIGNKTGKVNYSEVRGANLMQPNIMKLNQCHTWLEINSYCCKEQLWYNVDISH